MKQALMKNAAPVLNPAIKASLKRFYQAEKPLTPLEPAQRVLVFAPHIDDETIGLGGTIRRYADSGAQVTIAIITDGKTAMPLPSKPIRWPKRANRSYARSRICWALLMCVTWIIPIVKLSTWYQANVLWS